MAEAMINANTALASERDTREEFLQMVTALTHAEQRELWNELKHCGLIREEVNQ